MHKSVILFAITYLSRFSTYATKNHWDALIRVLRYLKTTAEIPFVLKLTNTTSKDKYNVTITADSDADSDGPITSLTGSLSRGVV
jgi:hypothetical protein